jgi:hypothetical protein
MVPYFTSCTLGLFSLAMAMWQSDGQRRRLVQLSKQNGQLLLERSHARL